VHGQGRPAAGVVGYSGRPANQGEHTEGGTVIFSRNGGSGGRHAAEEPRRSGDRSRRADSTRARSSAPDRDARRQSAENIDEPAEVIDAAPEFGPYDIEDAPEAERIDLGSLKIPSVPGVEVRVQANAEGVVQQVVLSTQESVLQLAVFAAPRSEGIWDEVRNRIRKQLSTEGVAVEEIGGDYGRELRARVRSEQGHTDIRFVGIDGPRWMVRAVYQGRAAAEPATAGALEVCLRGLVVDRGREAMPAEDALPLRLPREVAEQARAAAEAEAAEAAAAHSPTNGYASNGHAMNGHAAHHGEPLGDTVVNNVVPPPNGNGHQTVADPSAESRRSPSPRPRRPE
jgi:uncharacterized protein DUF3710